MKTPEKGNTPRPVVATGPKGRFVGLVQTAKERYQVHLIETVGETVVKRTVLYAGRTEPDGRVGDSLPVALAQLNAAVGKQIRERGAT